MSSYMLALYAARCLRASTAAESEAYLALAGLAKVWRERAKRAHQ